ncbi:MAG: hypothetical protein ACI8W3_001738 [Myxococcota bacterium]|jgi:hypothetical protein
MTLYIGTRSVNMEISGTESTDRAPILAYELAFEKS